MNRFPTASSPGQKRFAMDSLMSTTAGLVALSDSCRSRPRLIRKPSVLTRPGVIRRTATSGCSERAAAGWPSIATGCVEPPGNSGSELIIPAAVTPGIARTFCRTWS